MTIKMPRIVGKVQPQDERDKTLWSGDDRDRCAPQLICFPVCNGHLQSRVYNIRMVGMKLYLNYTAQGIANVWALDIQPSSLFL